MTAPLNGAVVANGIVKVDGNRKSVQHLDGGIVKELRVREGDQVEVGETLIVLDDTQARAEFDVLSEQFTVLRATEERLRTEFTGGSSLVVPADVGEETQARSIWDNQVRQFESRRVALDGQRNIIREKISQLEHQIVGGEAQVRALNAQLDSVREEMKSIAPLVDKGLIARPRYLQLERAGAGLDGQSADAMANIAKARQAIAEQQQQIVQLDNDRMADVTKELRDVQAKLLEVIPRLANAGAVLTRMEIRSPYAGRVVGLTVFSVGGVIQRGEKILDVVPEKDALVVETQVAVEDISEVRPKMRAEVHLTAYKQRITPIVHGTVLQVSADRLTENRTGTPYYTALLKLDEAELADMPNVQLYPGMPATVMVPTTERTAFEYLVGPLVMSFKHGFRQK
ncbi:MULTISPECIES: HlyD family type I secretion periplasmic adaptor subunit [unclassified Bradyrhizobium]|uniref:HlyD family type I secretion periplasmic adaptor subunit n=1 Tax=unclassified Bradyrhizobium TaxID=2631580 RepID=UPI00247AB45E|nr:MULTISPECIES: HlyD family type I secretion periplasmic adaptor subunit [unclassified Bradyrhizobium]WGR69603.1 HlyD family type I secretion periplasmic adaptor subunit [Bradyrhizobium sp. ISRA426]WGR81660.1 HlyD family type I secretion periplasmic adaptor subunit [Bradyrhizobium sp. ISRA430]WGR84844.1 HlyD family type I secretion periplasmic adaptor subunit [Bradyrhizobium sp. ISRA432]